MQTCRNMYKMHFINVKKSPNNQTLDLIFIHFPWSPCCRRGLGGQLGLAA